MAETELEMAQRHVAEGVARIARQRQLIDELSADGHMELAEEAERLLAQFLSIQREHIDHVQRLVVKRKGSPAD